MRLMPALACLLLLAWPAGAATLTVLAPGAFRAALDEIVPRFEAQSGHTVQLSYAPSAVIAQRIEAGEGFDLAITAPSALERFVRAGRVLEAPRAEVGANSVMLAWRRDAPAPDLSSEAGLRAALRGARAISFSDPGAGGSSSNYFMAVVAKLGMADEVRAKAILTRPAEGAQPVAEGRADLAAAQTSEVAMAPGLASARLNPQDPASSSRYGAGISAGAAQPEAARALLAFLAGTQAREIARAKGLAAE